MTRPQWITAGLALLLTIGIYAATQKQLFGPPGVRKPSAEMAANAAAPLSIDTILFHARQSLTPDQATRLNFLEHSISRGDVKEQQLHVYHQLAQFWADTANLFPPYAWYTAEAARLENSEKSLTFAAHLLLNSLTRDAAPEIKQWEALQAKDLFERSLKLNPANDSSKIGLGSVYLYGGIATPMEGIGMIRAVAERDSNNVYAQWALGQASISSGQLDKAVERFKKVARLQPKNWEAILLVAEVDEQMGNGEEAVKWYGKVLAFDVDADIKKEVEARIAKLRK